MEEKQIVTNKELESQLQSLRIKELIFKLLTYGCFAGIVIMWFLMDNLILGLVFVAIGIVFGSQWSNASSTLKKLLSDNIISGVLKEALGDGVEYNPVGRVEPVSMVFPFPYNKATGSDHIKADYKGLNIELSDIELIYETEEIDAEGNTQKSSATYFKGQWLVCDFGKELSGEVYLSANDKKLRKQHKNDSVEMENEAFNSRFLVTAKDAQEAYYIFTPHMMEYILTMADKSGGEVYMAFLRGGRLHVAVKTGRDFFEMGKSKANTDELRKKFLSELKWFTDIVDTLRVEDTLYKKEINA